MSSGRPSLRVHHEDVDEDDFHPRAPTRDHNLKMSPATYQADHVAKAPEKHKQLKKIFDVDGPTWDQEIGKPLAGDLFPQAHIEDHPCINKQVPTSSAKVVQDASPREKEAIQDIDMEMKEVVALHYAPAFYPGAVATFDPAKFDDNAKIMLATDIDDTFDMNATWQGDKETPSQRPSRSDYPVNFDWSEQEQLTRLAQSSADMAHEAWTQRASLVGAVHVPGDNAVGVAGSRNDGTVTVLSETPEAIVAEAVASDALAIEIRNDLLYELREEMQRHHVVAAVQEDSQDRAAPPFWTKKRSRAALLLLLLIVIIGVVFGAMAAAGVFENNDEGQCSEDFCSTGSILLSDQFEGQFEEDRFGSVVVISRDGATMAVGAEQGSYASVFQLVGKNWRPKGFRQPFKGDEKGDQFGRCVALNHDGSILAIGGWNNNAAGPKAGHVKVFWYNSTDWLPVGDPLLGSLAGDRFGWYVSLSDDGRTLAVGAKEGDPPEKTDAGYVRVYTYSGNFSQSNIGVWKPLGSNLDGEASADEFGKSVSLSADGRRLAVGASKSEGGKGRVRVFNFDGDLNVWRFVGQALNGENADEWLGGAISLSADGSVLAASASGTEKDKGSVLVWELKNSTWTKKGQTLEGESEDDNFGGSFLSLSGDGTCLAVGANHYSTDRGKGYLYRWENSQWKEIATVNGNIPGGRLGYSAAVSFDCKRFAVGASEYDVAKVAPEGTSSKGFVLVYEVLRE